MSTQTFEQTGFETAVFTGLQGYAETSYDKLVSVFGKPGRGDQYKTDAEWTLRFADGTIATIYNYKDGRNYLGDAGTPVEQIVRWHIGGRSRRAIDAVRAALGLSGEDVEYA